tara:strand:- start:123 stop:329 length:207 start_codon:yes stop_codon:yes gene_type:complete
MSGEEMYKQKIYTINDRTFQWLKEDNIVFQLNCEHKWRDYMLDIGETESDGSCLLCDNCGILVEEVNA